MNQKAIGKINNIGKTGAVIALVFNILFGIAFAGCLVGLIVVQVLPSDLVTFKLNGSADVNVNLSAFGNVIPQDQQNEAMKQIENSGYLSVDGNKFEVAKADVTGDHIHFIANGSLKEISFRNISYAILSAMVYLVMTFITVLFAGFLARAFAKCRSPFDADIIRKMKHFAYSLIPWAIISCVMNAMMSMIFSVGTTHVNLSVSFGYIVIVLVILALSYIFQYGAELQKEADETL